MLRWGVLVCIQAQQGSDLVVLRGLGRRFGVCSHVPWGHPQYFAAVKPKSSLLATSYSSLLAYRRKMTAEIAQGLLSAESCLENNHEAHGE